MYTNDNKNEYFIGETPILEFVDSNNEVIIKDDATENFEMTYLEENPNWRIAFTTSLINESISKIWT